MLKVSRNTLILITGFIWLFACLILFRRAYSWIEDLSDKQLFVGLLTAVLLAIIKTYFIFRNLTLRNINRILHSNQNKLSLWEFHVTKDKILIALMIVLGSSLRNSKLVPEYLLFPVYIGIGIAMFYVWMMYLKSFIKNRKHA